MNSLFIAQPPGRTTDKSLICSCGWHRVTNVLPMSVRFHRWTLGFRQSSFNHIAQALQSHNLHVFHYSPLHIHALVPFLFRVQVSCSPRRHCPERRPPLVVILIVRTTAHTFTAYRSSISKAHFDRMTRQYNYTDFTIVGGSNHALLLVGAPAKIEIRRHLLSHIKVVCPPFS